MKNLYNYFLTRKYLSITSEDKSIKEMFTLLGVDGEPNIAYPKYNRIWGYIYMIIRLPSRYKDEHNMIIQDNMKVLEDIFIRFGVIDLIEPEVRPLDEADGFSYYFIKLSPRLLNKYVLYFYGIALATAIFLFFKYLKPLIWTS